MNGIILTLKLITRVDYEANKHNHLLNITAGAIHFNAQLDSEQLVNLLQGNEQYVKAVFSEVIGKPENFKVKGRGNYVCLTPETLNMRQG